MSVTVLCGDARDLLPTLGADPARTVVITDPPWPNDGIDIVGGGIRAEETWRGVAPLIPAVADRLVLWLSALTDARLFLPAVPASMRFATTTWLRFVPPGYRGCFMAGDLAYVFGKMRMPDGARVLSAECVASDPAEMRRRRGLMHPCPRSIEHARWLLRWYAAKADLVIDPFCGSGTTLVAAAEIGIDAIGIDVDECWCDEARARVAAAESQQLIREAMP